MSCAICGKKTDPNFRPFCSKRCADIDLARWLGGTYTVPGDAVDLDQVDAADAQSDPLRDLRN